MQARRTTKTKRIAQRAGKVERIARKGRLDFDAYEGDSYKKNFYFSIFSMRVHMERNRQSKFFRGSEKGWSVLKPSDVHYDCTLGIGIKYIFTFKVSGYGHLAETAGETAF